MNKFYPALLSILMRPGPGDTGTGAEKYKQILYVGISRRAAGQTGIDLSISSHPVRAGTFGVFEVLSGVYLDGCLFRL